MQKQRINKQKIFDAAKIVAHLDKEPTTTNVREYLAYTGSQTTLHKYLKEWRMKCFQAYQSDNMLEAAPQEITKLQKENDSLTQIIAKMEEHSKIVANEFAKTERKNIELTQKVVQLESQKTLLEKEFIELKKDKEHTNNLYRDLKEEREILLGKMERDKDQLIASLQEELRQTHQKSLEKIQDISYHGHDLLMQEKVKAMNLEEKNKNLSVEMAKLQLELNNTNRIVEPLKTRIKQLEKLIAENITVEQLKEYERKLQSFIFVNNDK